MNALKTYYNDSIGKLERERDEWKARAERAEQFVRDHTMTSCTNPTCDCVEARLHRAESLLRDHGIALTDAEFYPDEET